MRMYVLTHSTTHTTYMKSNVIEQPKKQTSFLNLYFKILKAKGSPYKSLKLVSVFLINF